MGFRGSRVQIPPSRLESTNASQPHSLARIFVGREQFPLFFRLPQIVRVSREARHSDHSPGPTLGRAPQVRAPVPPSTTVRRLSRVTPQRTPRVTRARPERQRSALPRGSTDTAQPL